MAASPPRCRMPASRFRFDCDIVYFSSWPGSSRPSTSLARQESKTWMPGTSPGMTHRFNVHRCSRLQTNLRLLAARCARGLYLTSLENRGRRECRTLSASAAACAVVESTRVSHHGHAGYVRHSPRNGFNDCFALSRVTGLSCHPRLANHPAKLDASVGASGPHDFAVRAQCHSSFDMPRPSHPASTSVTIAKRPCCEDGMGRDVEVIWVGSEPEYFCERGWTGISVICPSGNRLAELVK